jgi:hypothetical protein
MELDNVLTAHEAKTISTTAQDQATGSG